MAEHIEKGTNYAYTIERIQGITFKALRSVVVDFIRRLPSSLTDELYHDIKHGVSKLQNEPELNMYIHALGMMHEAKLHYAFEHISEEFAKNPTIDIIDYGCGQAIGTICYADFLRHKGIIQTVRRITLIEPSEMALKRAALHVTCFFPDAEIITILKDFDNLDKSDIRIDEEVPTLNILSNVIDLADDYFNLEKFVCLLNECSIGKNQFICIEPYFDYDETDEKLDRFVKLLEAEIYHEKSFSKGTFIEGRDWTCRVVMGKCNKNYVNTSSNPIIKDLLDKGARYIKNCIIKKASYSNNLVNLTLANQILCYTSTTNYINSVIEKTNIISISLDSIAQVLNEDENLCWLVYSIVEYPFLVNKLLQDGNIDVIQQYVPKGCKYLNPFINNKNIQPQSINCDIIYNHCVKLILSKKGNETADNIADILLGFPIDNIALTMEFANHADKNKKYKDAFHFYEYAAQNGDPEAQLHVGIYYINGYGIERNATEAIKWYRKAAEQNNARAQCNLGVCYDNGQGVAKNKTEAVKWYRKAAEQNYAGAQCNLGVCYEYGQGVAKNETEAVKWYRKAAEQNYARAQCNLGVCYDNGQGVTKNKTEAVKWYRKAAEQNNARAQCNLGVCYEYGQGVAKNETEAVKWYRKAAEQNYSRAQFMLGCCYRDGKGLYKNDNEAIKWYIKAANHGCQSSVNELTKIKTVYIEERNCNVLGSDWYIKHYRELINWTSEVAQQGYPNAAYLLGKFYNNIQTYNKAAIWYLKAAEQGFAAAQYELGVCYEYGRGVTKDNIKAFKWYLKAAEQGNDMAQQCIAYCYKEGKGVAKDYNEAIKWYIKAAKKDDKEKEGEYLLKHCGGKCSNDWIERIAEKGYTNAQYILGNNYRQGDGVRQSYEKAAFWYTKAIENGCVEAQVSLGDLYENGNGVEQSYTEALEWYLKAAEQNNENAKYNIARLYALGLGVEQSTEKAINWLNQYKYTGHGLYSLGKLFYNGRSYEDAIKWWEIAAEANYVNAKYMLGVCYENGFGVQQSYEKAIAWWKKAIEDGSSKALESLAMLYEQGKGVKQSYEEAYKLCYMAAEKNRNTQAMLYLGNYYRYGLGVKRSYNETVKWYKMAAERYNLEAKKNLEMLYDYEGYNLLNKILFKLHILK